ncbi:MAG: hypothetical protein ACK5MA_05940 [Parachlamydiaceae bacterium]
MDINVKDTYNLFFHPFKGEGPTKKGLGRLAASVAIFIGTIGIYHLVVGSMQKWRITHPGEGERVGEVFQGVYGSQAASPAEAFFARHPQVIRPSMWKEWAEEAGIEIQTVTDEEAYDALPKNMEEILESPCRIFGGDKTVEQTRMHAYIPPGLKAEEMGKILKTRFPKSKAGYRFALSPILRESLMDYTTLGGWMEMTKDMIPGSRNQTYEEQRKMIKALCSKDELYEVPTTLEVIACSLSWYFYCGERLLGDAPWTYTRCQELVEFDRVIVGGFTPVGLCVVNAEVSNNHMGVAAMRKLS